VKQESIFSSFYFCPSLRSLRLRLFVQQVWFPFLQPLGQLLSEEKSKNYKALEPKNLLFGAYF